MSISVLPGPHRAWARLRCTVAAGLLLASTSALAASPDTSRPPDDVVPRNAPLQVTVAVEGVPGTAGSLDLPRALSLALSRASLLQAGEARLESARQEARRAGQLPDPELVLGIDNLPITGNTAFDFSADDMTMKRIGLRQMMPARGKREAARSLAGRRIDEAAANIVATSLEVQRETAQAWMDAWAASRTLAALRKLRDEAQLAARVAKARVSAGAESPSNALATQAEVIELDNRILAMEARREAAIVELSRWTGAQLAPADTAVPDLDRLPIAPDRLLASVDRLASLLQADAQVASASAAIVAARAETRSDWSVGAAYGQRDGGRDDMVMLEVGIGLPLFTRNRQDRGVAARQADFEATLLEREDLRRSLSARIRADVARWEGLKRQVALLEGTLLPLARDRSAVALAGYRAGGDLQPWINSRRDEVQVQLTLAELRGDLGRAWTMLAYLLPHGDAR